MDDASVTIVVTMAFRLAKFLLIFWAAGKLALIIENRSSRKPLKGIVFLATLIITMAVYDLIKYTDWQFYYNQGRYQFQGLPGQDQMIVARYVFSVMWRIALITVAIGLLYLNARAMQTAIALAWIQIVTIYWKHPIAVFQHLTLQIQQQTVPGSTELLYPWQPWVAFAFFSLWDVIPAILVIYYLTRPHVKKQFT